VVVTPPDAAPPGRIVSLHPNPFRTQVQLVVPTPLAKPVNVQVVDLGGRALRTLQLAAGQRFLIWDGTNDAGVGVPAGIYWVRVPGGSQARVVRLR
jgi:flagellar hook assembly protein FlgD